MAMRIPEHLRVKCFSCKKIMWRTGTKEKSLIICDDCAETKVANLKEELIKSLSEEQRKIFENLIEAIDYCTSDTILAT
ncbi:MAG: hypothetical protein KGI39_02955 [Patescibacteria group bacterium]|nr:hypothetical protein [Patescibacteria group bacterium]